MQGLTLTAVGMTRSRRWRSHRRFQVSPRCLTSVLLSFFTICFFESQVDADLAINCMMWQNAGKSGMDQWNFTLQPTSKGQVRSVEPISPTLQSCPVHESLPHRLTLGPGSPRHRRRRSGLSCSVPSRAEGTMSTSVRPATSTNLKQMFPMQDPDGSFIRCWVLEVAQLPYNYIHRPYM